MQDFEKLGAFYLGMRYDGDADKLTDEYVLYDSKDLTTHAAIVRMTGSGKTGLGIGLLEEAADVERAKQTAAKIKADMAALNKQLEKDVADLDTAFDAQTGELTETVVRAKSTDIHVAVTGLAWLPYAADKKGRLRPAW
jgi:hypothetical protein